MTSAEKKKKCWIFRGLNISVDITAILINNETPKWR